MADEQSFSSTWEWLQTEVEARSSQYAAELEAAWAELASLLHAQIAAFERETSSVAQHTGLTSLRHLMSDVADRLLFEMVHFYRKVRPQERALAALETYEAGLEDLTRSLPQTIAVQGQDLLEVLQVGSLSRLGRYLLKRRRSPVQLPIRQIVESRLLSDAKDRTELDGAYFFALARGSLLLLAPWQAVRREGLRRSAGQGVDAQALMETRARWLKRVRLLEGGAGEAAQNITLWSRGAGTRVATALLRRGTRLSPRRQRRWSMNRQTCFRHWSRQQRAVRAVLDLEFELANVALGVTAAGERGLDSLDREQAGLREELDQVIQWLQEARPEEGREGFPPPQAELISADDRASDWERASEASALAHLLPTVETVEPRHALPSWRSPWRTLEPRRVFLSALARSGRETVLEGFREAEADHRAIVREIERAREVVTFSLETSGKEGEEGRRIAQDGIANALALVSYRKQTVTDPHALAERKLAEATAAVVTLTHVALDQGRLGLLTQLAQQSGSKLVRDAWQLGLEKTSEAGRWVRDRLRAEYHRDLQKIGWEAPPIGVVAPVISQAYLREVLNLQPGTRDLPMIYQRLFRLAPVEEPRFLVGRESEMAALAHARSLWQARRSVSVMLVGARGSGKTSLLNCASASEFPDATIVRSQFRDRITDAAQMRTFLHELFGLHADDDLLANLSSRPRVVMLEEMERTFLRAMNGFGGLRELLSIISATSRTTLWILSLNQHSFGYLDAAVNLSRHFTHRINAMAVPPRDLKSAILLRHHLSGLRLEYPPLPESDPRVSRIRQLLGLQQTAEELFFDSLYRQSEGVFRSAFELWQHYMERVEGGVLYLREPREPDFEHMIGQLTLDDAFALQAILQHGNLTEQDHSRIFECPIASSRMELERLIGLECLEPEPSSSGLRIRPEAGRFVHMALHRLNLI
jgi:hypothetical protein